MHTSPTAIHRRVAACRAGEDRTVIARLPSGWAVLSDPQVLRGYCLLLPDPVVPHLNALETSAQRAFLSEMARLGDVVYRVTGAVRVNYALFGNLEPALHAHVFPRYADEPAHLATANPWGYDWGAAPAFDATRDRDLMERLRKELAATGA